MKKSLRIGYNRYYDERIFKEHLKYVKENADVIDEITLFAEFSHYGYWSLEFCKKNAEILKDRIARYKKIGIKSVGINILDTIGHLEEGWSVFPKARLQYMINENGEESKSCLCPSNEDFLKYISKKYALYAATGADFIWYDDDVRTHHHGVAENGCFCQKCIDKFNKKYSAAFTRDLLATALQNDNATKQKWSELQSGIKRTLVKTISDSIKGVSPKIKIGAMTTEIDSLDGDEAVKIDWYRPGGGFYNDDIPASVLDKYFAVQNQVLHYPPDGDDIQYEYETFNSIGYVTKCSYALCYSL